MVSCWLSTKWLLAIDPVTKCGPCFWPVVKYSWLCTTCIGLCGWALIVCVYLGESTDVTTESWNVLIMISLLACRHTHTSFCCFICLRLVIPEYLLIPSTLCSNIFPQWYHKNTNNYFLHYEDHCVFSTTPDSPLSTEHVLQVQNIEAP